MTPLKIEITLSTPAIIRGRLPTIDALLAWVAFEENQVAGAIEKLPLKRTKGIWHASQLFYLADEFGPLPVAAPFTANMITRKVDPLHDKLITGKWQSDKGRQKSDLDVYEAVESRTLIGFAYGNKDEVQIMLRALPGVGRKINQGYGKIERVKVEEISTDRSLYRADGSPARPLPAVSCGYMAMGTISAPYWDKAAYSPINIPHSQIIVAGEIEQNYEVPCVLPKTTLEKEYGYQSGIAFFYEHLGSKLVDFQRKRLPADGQCAICGDREVTRPQSDNAYTLLCTRCVTFGGTYQGIKTPCFMGDGWAGLVTKSKSILVTTTNYNDLPFPGVDGLEILSQPKTATRLLFERLLDNPPKEPFLYFEGNKNYPGVARNLTVSWSPEYAALCGRDGVTTFNVFEVKKARMLQKSALSKAKKLMTQFVASVEPDRKEAARIELGKHFYNNKKVVEVVNSWPLNEQGLWSLAIRAAQ